MRRLLMGGLLLLAAAFVAVSVAATVGIVRGEGQLAPADTFISKLAARLGVSEEELRTAITEVRNEMIDEAVTQGRLTAEQGERLRQRSDAGGLLRPRHHARHPAGRLIIGSAATVLDMTPQELVAELRGGKSLAEVAEEQGMSAEEFKAALLEQVQENLDELVAQGKLRQEQAETIFAHIEENIDRIINGTGPG